MHISDFFTSLLNNTYLNNTYLGWIIAFIVFLIVSSILYITKVWFTNRLKKTNLSTSGRYISSMISKTKFLFIMVIALILASKLLNIPEKGSHILNKLPFFIILFQIGIWSNFFICLTVDSCLIKDQNGKTSSFFINIALKTLLWFIILMLALDNLGVNITALIGGLGIGGIAVALAVQNILGDLLASLSIIVDKPFEVGDFIVINEFSGTVQNTGLKTTRLKSISGEQLVFSNSDLLKSVIKNYKRMNERRIVLKIGVTYQTPLEKLQTIPSLLQTITKSYKEIRFDRAHFSEFGPYSLNFELVYWILDPTYNIYMDFQEKINLEIIKNFRSLNVEFAYPTQAVIVQNK